MKCMQNMVYRQYVYISKILIINLYEGIYDFVLKPFYEYNSVES